MNVCRGMQDAIGGAGRAWREDGRPIGCADEELPGGGWVMGCFCNQWQPGSLVRVLSEAGGNEEVAQGEW